MSAPQTTDLTGIGFAPASHKTALHVLMALYLDSRNLQKAEGGINHLRQVRIMLAIYLHALPYLLLLLILSRWLLVGTLNSSAVDGYTLVFHAQWVAGGLALGLVVGLAFALAFGIVFGLTVGLFWGLSLSLLLGVIASLSSGAPFALFFGLGIGFVIGLVTGLVAGLAVGLPSGLDAGLRAGLFSGLAVGLAAGLAAGLSGSLTERLISCLFSGLLTGFVVAVFSGLAYNWAAGLTIGILSGLAVALAYGLGGNLAAGFAYCTTLGVAFGIASGFRDNLAGGLVLGLAYSIAVGLIGSLAGGPTYGVHVGLAEGFACLFCLLRFYHQPVHWWLVLFGTPEEFRCRHPVFWDTSCKLPFPGLRGLLIRYAGFNPKDASAQIDHLTWDYPAQRSIALKAKTILTARASATVESLTSLEVLLSELPAGDTGYLAQTGHVRERGMAVSRQQRFVDSVNRPFFREQALQALRAEVNAFYAQIGGYYEPLATEFRKAAEAWLKLVDAQQAEVQSQRQRELTPQVFRAGDPVERDAEAFVARLDIYGALEHEIIAGPGCPGLLLYGRRRLGKSTILRNLEGFLPEPVMPVIVSMQNPRAFTSEASLAALLAEEIRRVWPTATLLGPEAKDLVTFFQFLGACNAQLEADQRRLILGLDEFEELDRRIGLKQFTEDFAATLRESVQSHRRITWMFAASHHFSELPNVRWSSYLVSLRTLELPPFTPEETRLLLSQPLKHSRRKEAQAAVAAFGAGFWGDGGMDRIHAEAGGWPHLVQLIASTVVDLCNTQGEPRAKAAILDDALTKAVVSGDSVLGELMLYRSEEYPAAWSYLSGFRTKDVHPPPEDDALRLTLKRHLLVKEIAGGQWTLRVPLMQRWLRERM